MGSPRTAETSSRSSAEAHSKPSVETLATKAWCPAEARSQLPGRLIGLLPFACAPDFGALIVHASRLARHTRGLRHGAPFDALVHAPESPDLDPLQIPRVTPQGRVATLPDEGPEVDAARAAHLERLPSAEVVLGLGDFRFFRLEIERGRLVAGFAQATSITKETLRQLR